MTTFKRYDDAAAVETDPDTGNPAEGGNVTYGTVTEARTWSVTARIGGETRFFLIDSRGRAWTDGGRWRLVPVCDHCQNPVTGTPVTAEYDPMGRRWCSEDCLTSDAERAGGAMASVEYDDSYERTV